MANPFTNGPFNCCTCPEPPGYDPEVDDPLATYVNLCGCPSVVIACESSQKTVTLEGFDQEDVGGTLESPPKKFKEIIISGSETTEDQNNGVCCFNFTLTYSGTWSYQYTFSTTAGAPFFPSETTPVKRVSQQNPVAECEIVSGPGCPTEYEPTESTDARHGPSLPSFYDAAPTKSLSSEDTEADAIARATAVDGTECSAIYELRTDSFSFTIRTATYTATASNLVVGVQYQGCVRLQRREAYSGTEPEGADTAWEDVQPDTIPAFTATDTEEEVATDVALPGGNEEAKGWEYRAVSAHVWPTSAGCDCPTDYTTP